MREEEANGLSVVSTTASLGQRGADINGLDFVASLLLLGVRDSVGHNKAVQTATVQVLDGLAREDTVDDNGVDFLGTVLKDGVGSLDEGATGIGHVVDDDGDLVLDVTDKNHAGDLVGPGTLLVNQGELQIETVSNGSSTRLKKKLDLIS